MQRSPGDPSLIARGLLLVTNGVMCKLIEVTTTVSRRGENPCSCLRARGERPQRGGSTMTKKLGLDEARVVVEAVLGAASGRNLRFAAAVVDSGGELVYFARMDGASPLNARMAVNKAYTATKWRHNTRAIQDRLFDMGLGDDRRDIAWFGDPRFTAVWGGILLTGADGEVLGAVGESGGTPAQDEELGQIGANVRRPLTPPAATSTRLATQAVITRKRWSSSVAIWLTRSISQERYSRIASSRPWPRSRADSTTSSALLAMWVAPVSTGRPAATHALVPAA
jgi:uncharacterized protein GlcG (DUF336 family)